MPTAVVRLFRACRDAFADCGAGIVPKPEEVERIQSLLGMDEVYIYKFEVSIDFFSPYSYWAWDEGMHYTRNYKSDLYSFLTIVRRCVGYYDDKIKPTDVNVTPNMFRNVKPINGMMPVTYLHLYECDKFSIGVFCLPPEAVIPLHNHPEMTVFSKILFGSMHINSYDWMGVLKEPNDNIDSNHFEPPKMRLAKVNTDGVFKAPCPTSILYPTSGGNVHCFTAVTSCAVLDVLCPPYSVSQGRHCTYYNVFPYESSSADANDLPVGAEKYAWLEVREKPEDFYVVPGEYTGPKIVDR